MEYQKKDSFIDDTRHAIIRHVCVQIIKGIVDNRKKVYMTKYQEHAEIPVYCAFMFNENQQKTRLKACIW